MPAGTINHYKKGIAVFLSMHISGTISIIVQRNLPWMSE